MTDNSKYPDTDSTSTDKNANDGAEQSTSTGDNASADQSKAAGTDGTDTKK